MHPEAWGNDGKLTRPGKLVKYMLVVVVAARESPGELKTCGFGRKSIGLINVCMKINGFA